MGTVADFSKALNQAFDRRFLHVLLVSLALTIGLLIAVTMALVWLTTALLPASWTLPFLGEISGISTFASLAIVPVMLVFSAFVMFPVAAVFMGFFLDWIADAVEDQHYPSLPPAGEVTFLSGLWEGGKFALIILLVNLVALLIYAFSFFAAPILFWALNGYLLGREYFSQVAFRRMAPAEANTLRRAHRWQIWIAGTLMAIPLSIPILNLIVPVIGVATFTHMFHRIRGADV